MQLDLLMNLKNVIYSVTIASFIIIFLITLSTTYNPNSLIALIVSYSIVVSSLVLMFGILYNKELTTSLFDKIITLFPLVIIIGILMLMVYLLVSYFDKIASNNVSNYYYTFSILTNIFLVTQLFILYNNIGFETSKYISNKTFSILTLLGTINMILVITLNVILKYYSTDG
jgi:hypothetical protein